MQAHKLLQQLNPSLDLPDVDTGHPVTGSNALPVGEANDTCTQGVPSIKYPGPEPGTHEDPLQGQSQVPIQHSLPQGHTSGLWGHTNPHVSFHVAPSKSLLVSQLLLVFSGSQSQVNTDPFSAGIKRPKLMPVLEFPLLIEAG